jgi:hypothetical protein
MSGLGLWNPAKKPDKAGVTRDKSEKPGHVRVISLEPDKE